MFGCNDPSKCCCISLSCGVILVAIVQIVEALAISTASTFALINFNLYTPQIKSFLEEINYRQTNERRESLSWMAGWERWHKILSVDKEKAGNQLNANINQDLNEGVEHVYWITIVILVVGVISFLFGILQLVGAQKGWRYLLVPWIILTVISICSSLVVVIIYVGFNVYFLGWRATSVFFLVVTCSLFQDLDMRAWRAQHKRKREAMQMTEHNKSTRNTRESRNTRETRDTRETRNTKEARKNTRESKNARDTRETRREM